MNQEIRKIEPQAVWNKFTDLNAVPRPSKKEEKVRKFMREFGKSLNLETLEDKIGNVVIKKPATAGMENRKTVVLQSHLDMVTQKNNDVEHDFETQGIEMYIDGDWVRAKGTTLGADNGLGVAAIMAILESKDIPHPPIEALFTIDEETGMTGAKQLDDTILSGDILLNLDTEEDDEIDIGCAGGIDITAHKNYKEIVPKENAQAFLVKLTGLSGGHSGMDIHKGLGNANKLMNRVLYAGNLKTEIQISTINGGGLRNAIPRESEAVIVVENANAEELKNRFEAEIKAVIKEYESLEENLKIEIEETALPEKVMDAENSKKLLLAIYATHNGVYRMSPDIADLVETSNNLARVEVKNGKIEIQCLTRSSQETNKQDLTNTLTAVFELSDFEVKTSGEYPGWQPNPDSEVLKMIDNLYEELHGEKARVVACHAGLECGILLSHYPNMDTVSFGPTIRGAHSPDERASIASTQKFWKFLQEVLKNTPEK